MGRQEGRQCSQPKEGKREILDLLFVYRNYSKLNRSLAAEPKNASLQLRHTHAPTKLAFPRRSLLTTGYAVLLIPLGICISCHPLRPFGAASRVYNASSPAAGEQLASPLRSLVWTNL